MKKLLLLLALVYAISAHAATTWNVTPSSNLQSVINGASAGDTISFAAGTYNVGGSLTGKCGITYTGPAIPISTYTAGDGLKYQGYFGQTAILNGTFRGSNSGSMINFTNGGSWANPCTQPTVIQYLSFMNVGGIYMQASYTNVTFQYNNFGNIPGQTGPNPGSTGIYLDGGNQGSNTAQTFTNILIQWNRIGDFNSCLTPTNTYADVSSPDGDGDAGGCNGTIINSSLNGVQYLNNNFLHVSEGTHINCPGGNNPGRGASPCEPSANGATTRNLKIWYNDFSSTHRMDWEEQPQTTFGIDAEFNTMHDKLNTPGSSFGWSFACCIVGATSPYINVANNVIAWNLPPASGNRYGYGIEAWGNNGNYNNNVLGIASNYPAAAGITWGVDGAAPSEGLNSVSSNYICNGNSWANGQFSVAECDGSSGCGGFKSKTPNVQSGNNYTFNACASITSVAPSISPASGGTFSGSQTVTFHDPGYTSGANALGNTGIWYTTDGSTPVPGSNGTYISDGGSITSSATTIKAVGMWGAQNQTVKYGTGLGYVPSAVTTNTYTGGGPPTTAIPTFSPSTPNDPFFPTVSVTVSDTTAGAVIHCSTTGVPTPSSPVYSTPFNISSTTTIQCLAVASGFSNSSVGSNTYVLTPPALTGCYQGNLTPYVNTLPVGGLQQQTVYCQYASGTSPLVCSAGPDANGSSVTSWGTLSTGIISVGNVGATAGCSGGTQGPGCVKGLAVGNDNVTATVNGTLACSQWTYYITNATPTLSSVTITFQGGGSTVQAGNSITACANMNYTSPIVNTQVCGGGTDSYGTVVGSFTSSAPSFATIGSSTGIALGVTAGSTNIGLTSTPTVGGPITPSAVPLTVTAAQSIGVTLQGATNFSGNVQIQ